MENCSTSATAHAPAKTRADSRSRAGTDSTRTRKNPTTLVGVMGLREGATCEPTGPGGHPVSGRTTRPTRR